MNQNKILKREERKGIKNPNGPFSLSKTFQKNYSKKNSLCFHNCPGSSKNKTYKFWTMVSNATLQIYKTYLYGIFLPIFQMNFKRFPCYQTMVMVGFYSQQAFQPYQIHKVWSWCDTPTICFTIVLLIGIILPLIKM